MTAVSRLDLGVSLHAVPAVTSDVFTFSSSVGLLTEVELRAYAHRQSSSSNTKISENSGVGFFGRPARQFETFAVRLFHGGEKTELLCGFESRTEIERSKEQQPTSCTSTTLSQLGHFRNLSHRF